MKHGIYLAAALLFSSSAMAETCQHGQQRMSIGGTDLDEMRCQLQTAADVASSLTSQNILMTAKVRMLTADLAAANAEVEKLRAEGEKKPAQKSEDKQQEKTP